MIDIHDMKRSEIKKRPLPPTVLDNLEPEEKEYRELDGNGLYFRVQANGKKGWLFRYKKDNGKWSWLGLGTYPAVNGASARKKAAELADSMARGESIQSRADVKQQQAEDATMMFEVLMNDWLATKQNSWDAVTYDKAVKSIERHIMPEFGKRDYTQIEPQMWLDFFHGLQRNLGIHTQTEKLTSYCRSAYNLAKFRKKIKYNPLEGITEFLDKGNAGSMSHVSFEEMPNLLRAIRKHPSRPIAIGLELLALLFPRPSELREAVWSEFDLDKAEWVKPPERMKTGIIHAVPLPQQAVALLKELQSYRTESEFLFPSRDSLDKPISNMTFNVALNRLGYKNRQNPHGFRHIASTELNRQFSDKAQVIEAALAHLKKGVKGKYDKGTHFEERIEMMQWWADELDRIMG